MQHFALRCKQKKKNVYKLFWLANKNQNYLQAASKQSSTTDKHSDNFAILQVVFVPTLPPEKLTWLMSLCLRWPSSAEWRWSDRVLIYVGSRWCIRDG